MQSVPDVGNFAHSGGRVFASRRLAVLIPCALEIVWQVSVDFTV